ncbi:MAG: response regulator [Thermoanaerobaculia bacterium]|nr:response regulator [Thermoanaerobaculia bacterium]
MRDSLCRLLDAVGIEAKSYASAELFLESFDPGRLGCLVTEVELPGLSGLDLLDRLRDREIESRAVVLASHGEVGRAVRAMRSGAIDFLEKPFVDRILLQRILEVLGRDASRGPTKDRSDAVRR